MTEVQAVAHHAHGHQSGAVEEFEYAILVKDAQE